MQEKRKSNLVPITKKIQHSTPQNPQVFHHAKNWEQIFHKHTSSGKKNAYGVFLLGLLIAPSPSILGRHCAALLEWERNDAGWGGNIHLLVVHPGGAVFPGFSEDLGCILADFPCIFGYI